MNKLNYMRSLPIALVATILASCAAQPSLTQDQVINQYPQIQALDSALQQAESAEAQILAPKTYQSTAKLLSESISAAQEGKIEKAQTIAQEGLNQVSGLTSTTANSREIMQDVLQAREHLYAADVVSLHSTEVTDLDNDLMKATMLIEKGNIEKAKKLRPELLADYQNLELSTLKKGIVDQAMAAVADAKKQRAAKLAPKTFARAEEQMLLATNLLDSDRSQTVEAEAYAKEAKWLAEKSASIAETVTDFDRRDYSTEDIILWHQRQLEVINQPLGLALPFNLADTKPAESLRDAIVAQQEEMKAAIATEQEANDKLAINTQAHQNELAARQEELIKENAYQKKCDIVQDMFNANEANVYLQGENVVVSAFGFDFLSGKSEIQTKNFPLMNKIIRAIKIFPNADIEVIGHTDSTGDETVNQSLSNDRAEKVAKFLVEIGDVSQDKITSQGYGESRPIATNETIPGRAENRRVEIIIKNK